MSNVTLQTRNLNVQVDFQPSADFVGCLLSSLIASLPCFLKAFTECLADKPPSDSYRPGDRSRCD